MCQLCMCSALTDGPSREAAHDDEDDDERRDRCPEQSGRLSHCCLLLIPDPFLRSL